jgi:cytochrome b561
MQFKNTLHNYSIITKSLHLITSVFIIIQFILVYWREYLTQANSLKLTLILLHKSIGFSLLFIGLFFIIWRFLNTKPKFPKNMARWEAIIATATHHSLYLCILLMPLTGTLMSLLSGKAILWFGLPIPLTLEINKSLAGFMYTSHVWISYLLAGFIILHAIGALKHYFINKDQILQRMFHK